MVQFLDKIIANLKLCVGRMILMRLRLLSLFILCKTRKTDSRPNTQNTLLRASIRLKDALDSISWKSFSARKLTTESFTKFPDKFIVMYLPLTPIFSTGTPASLQQIDPYRTIGFDSIKFSDIKAPHNHDRQNNPQNFFDQLNDYTIRDTAGACRGYSLSVFEVFYLYEGLSRPQLAKQLDQPLSARISSINHPPASEMLIINFYNTTYIILHRESLQWSFVPLPRFTIPLLRGSGVEEMREYNPIVTVRGLITSYKAILSYVS